jgi:hypothetical protein
MRDGEAAVPQRKRPITQRPKVEDESTGNPPVRRGKHQPWDEALPGKGGTKAGLNKYSGVSRRTHARARHRRPPTVGGGRKENLGRAEGSRRPVRDTGDS